MILRDPALELDLRVRRLWTFQWAIAGVVAVAVTALVAVPLVMSDRGAAALVVALLGGLLVAGLVAAAVVEPGLRYRRFRYEITELGLYVARGRLWRTWQVVPHARVQTVDTKRGPLERSFGLVSVSVSTASARGGTDIPGLDPLVADSLVEELSRRAGIEEGT